YLCINHGWAAFRKKRNMAPLPRPLAIGLTFLAVIIAWVPFKAGAFEHGTSGSTAQAITATKNILAAMFGFNGFQGWPDNSAYVAKDAHAFRACLWLFVVWFMPNTQEFLRRYSPALDVGTFDDNRVGPRRWWQWRPTGMWFAFTLILLLITIAQFDKVSEFIYFQF
ncbi:MAG: hypothetical protein CFE26_16600, partial [Verrucomicrobiales bacterium VVV1]